MSGGEPSWAAGSGVGTHAIVVARCSCCQARCPHNLKTPRDAPLRSTYVCSQCKKRTLCCRTAGCDAMAAGSDSTWIPDAWYCLKCNRTITNWPMSDEERASQRATMLAAAEARLEKETNRGIPPGRAAARAAAPTRAQGEGGPPAQGRMMDKGAWN